jgi:hypothetical protein
MGGWRRKAECGGHRGGEDQPDDPAGPDRTPGPSLAILDVQTHAVADG